MCRMNEKPDDPCIRNRSGCGFPANGKPPCAGHGISVEVSAIKDPMWKFMHRDKRSRCRRIFQRAERTSTEACGNLKINTENNRRSRNSLSSLTLSKVRKQKGRSLFPRILQSAMSARKKCLTRKTDGICIRLSTVPAVDRGLRFWIHCRMTGNVPV